MLPLEQSGIFAEETEWKSPINEDTVRRLQTFEKKLKDGIRHGNAEQAKTEFQNYKFVVLFFEYVVYLFCLRTEIQEMLSDIENDLRTAIEKCLQPPEKAKLNAFMKGVSVKKFQVSEELYGAIIKFQILNDESVCVRFVKKMNVSMRMLKL